MPLQIQFEDDDGNRLEIVLERVSPSRLRTFVRYRRQRSTDRGATTFHTSERTAARAVRDLEIQVLAEGWHRRVVEAKDRSAPAPMKTSADGRRLFRDANTGEYREDLSSERPPQVPMARVQRQVAPPRAVLVRRITDMFSIDSLPKPRGRVT